jgi:hypothetical protein
MPPIDESPSFGPKPPSPEARKPKTTAAAGEPSSKPNLVGLTIDVAAGRVVKVEAMDGSGAARELSEDERTRLAKSEDGATLQRLLEQAFEAGIACVLGDRGGEEEPPESDEDAEISRMLLQSLIRRSAAERLMQREILSRAIVGTLIEQAAAPETATH